ncbi:unnamed protein product [Camellia sinensis]
MERNKYYHKVSNSEGKIIYTDTDKIFLSGNGDTLNIPLVMYQRSNKILVRFKNPRFSEVDALKKDKF